MDKNWYVTSMQLNTLFDYYLHEGRKYMTHTVAAYGSLKRGFGNHRLLAQEPVTTGFTSENNFTMHSLGPFPGVVHGGGDFIQVEVYQVDDEAFSRLDALEGHPNFYKRERIRIDGDDDTSYNAWLYIYQGNTDHSPVVEHGVW